jgi:hypothetical protein
MSVAAGDATGEHVRVVIPDAGPLNTLAAPGLLHLLLAPANVDLVLIKSVVDEIKVRSAELKAFIARHEARIVVVTTSVCAETEARRARGAPVGRGRGDLAIADFILNSIDETLGNEPALVIYEDRKLGRLAGVEGISEKAHFITTAAYLRKLEEEGVISSFADTWRQIVSANSSGDSGIHREPSPHEAETPASSPKGSKIRVK